MNVQAIVKHITGAAVSITLILSIKGCLEFEGRKALYRECRKANHADCVEIVGRQ